MKKAQFALEFVVLVSFTIIFTAVFLVMIQGNYVRAQQYKQEIQVGQVVRILTNEIDLAQSSPAGYTREFYIPNSIEGVPYKVKSSDGIDLVFDYSGKTYVFYLPSGELENYVFLKTGHNTIQKFCSSPPVVVCSVKLLNPA
jgi:hypothetical protein